MASAQRRRPRPASGKLAGSTDSGASELLSLKKTLASAEDLFRAPMANYVPGLKRHGAGYSPRHATTGGGGAGGRQAGACVQPEFRRKATASGSMWMHAVPNWAGERNSDRTDDAAAARAMSHAAADVQASLGTLTAACSSSIGQQRRDSWGRGLVAPPGAGAADRPGATDRPAPLPATAAAGVAGWDVERVGLWLRRDANFGAYEHAFRQHEVDGAVLCTLDELDLLAIGVTSVGHRKRMLQAVTELRVVSADGNNPKGRLADLRESASRLLARAPQLPLQCRRALQECIDSQHALCSRTLVQVESERAGRERWKLQTEGAMKVGARRAIERALIEAAESADEVCRLRQTIEDERASIEAERALNDMMREDLADLAALRGVEEEMAMVRMENNRLRLALTATEARSESWEEIKRSRVAEVSEQSAKWDELLADAEDSAKETAATLSVGRSVLNAAARAPPAAAADAEEAVPSADESKAEEKARRLAAREERRRREAERAALSATPPPKPAVSPSALDGW